MFTITLSLIALVVGVVLGFVFRLGRGFTIAALLLAVALSFTFYKSLAVGAWPANLSVLNSFTFAGAVLFAIWSMISVINRETETVEFIPKE